MIVTIRYLDGHIECFDSNSLTGGSVYGHDSVLTEFHLAMEKTNDGSRIALYSHHLEDSRESTDDLSIETDRIRGPWSQLASPEDEPLIESIHLDGQLAAWRQGGKLIDALKFDLACHKWLSGMSGQSANSRACALFNYLAKAHPELGGNEADVCALFGYPVEAFREAEDEEMSAACALEFEEESNESD